MKNTHENNAKMTDLSTSLAARGFSLRAVEIQTADGRTWCIRPVAAGRGRWEDGHWGPKTGATGGFRLFEVDTDEMTYDEHDAVDSDVWQRSDLMDYLGAVGAKKN